MLKLKLQYFWHLMQTLEKSLMLRKIEGRGKESQSMRWLDAIANAMDMNLGKLQEMVRAAVHGFERVRRATEQHQEQQIAYKGLPRWH